MNYADDTERTARINAVTVNSRIVSWVDNFKANLPEIAGGYAVASLINKMKDVPVIVVGSGPTLDRNIHDLCGLEDKALIISAGSNTAALQKAGVNPHLVLMADSLALNQTVLDGVDLSRCNYILDSFVHPESVARLMDARRIYWYNSPHLPICPFTGALSQWTGGLGIVVSGGCGATAMWQVGRILGCSPDVLVGLPEAYYDPSQHYAKVVTDNHPVLTYAESEKAEDHKGDMCYTNNAYKSFAAWFEHAFMNIAGQHINCSEGGIIKEGCLIMTLKECKEQVLTKTFDIESLLFADELQIDSWYQDILAGDDWWVRRAFLTMMVESATYGEDLHTNLPEIARRMGWTHQRVAQEVIALRELGVNIKEEPCVWTPGPNKPQEPTLQYWVVEPITEVTPTGVVYTDDQGVVVADPLMSGDVPSSALGRGDAEVASDG